MAPIIYLCLAQEEAAMGEEMVAGTAPRCMGMTRAGKPCRRRAVKAGFCTRHGTPAFYARALSPEERQRYEEALAQEGLAGEVAVLRLHLLRLLASGEPDVRAEIPRTVHALVRALKDGRAGGGDPLADLDAVIREEGRRWLDGHSALEE